MAAHYQSGKYRATVTAQGFEQGQYGWEFHLRVMPQGGDYERTVYMRLTDENGNRAQSRAGEDIGKKNIQTLEFLAGGSLPSVSSLDPETDGHISLVGKEIDVSCVVSTKEDGETKEAWYVETPRNKPLGPADKKGLQKLDALFGRDLRRPGKPQGKPAAKPLNESTPRLMVGDGKDVDDPGIPF